MVVILRSSEWQGCVKLQHRHFSTPAERMSFCHSKPNLLLFPRTFVLSLKVERINSNLRPLELENVSRKKTVVKVALLGVEFVLF
jgi:hypothetical protein